MIITKTVTISPTGKLKSIYLKKGYYPNAENKINIKVEDLLTTSHIYVDVICDSCGKEGRTQYRRCYDGYLCNYCSSRKGCFEKYGVVNPFQSSEIKNKIKETLIEKYGVDVPLRSKLIYDKLIVTNLQKWGVENVFQSEEIKEKCKNTSIENWGVEHPMKSEEVQDMMKKSCFEKWGVEFPMKLEEVSNKSKENRKKYIFEFIKKSHSDLDIVEIDQVFNVYKIKCDNKKNHVFEIYPTLLNNRKRTKTTICTICNPLNSYQSGVQMKVSEFIRNLGISFESNVRNIIDGELDIWIPSKNISIEVNGLFWHSSFNKDKDYHLIKTMKCNQMGIRLIHLWEDDWTFKQKISESIIKNSLGITDRTIWARKCKVVMMDNNSIVRQFLNENHIQGYVGSNIKIGLFHENELVSLLTLGKKRLSLGTKDSSTGSYEILRFCNKLNTSVVGGFSKMLSFFQKNYEFNEIITYSDVGYFTGKTYEENGFKFVGMTKPNYYYTKGNKRYHRFNFRKDKLVKEGFDPNLTEFEIMDSLKIHRIYNAGNRKYVLNSKSQN